MQHNILSLIESVIHSFICLNHKYTLCVYCMGFTTNTSPLKKHPRGVYASGGPRGAPEAQKLKKRGEIEMSKLMSTSNKRPCVRIPI